MHLNLLPRLFPVRFLENTSPGIYREQEPSLFLDQADLIVCLVSPDVVADCYEEMEQLARRRNAENVPVIPVLVRAVAGWEKTPLGKLQSLPRDGKPLSSRRDRERAMSEIAHQIRELVEHFSD